VFKSHYAHTDLAAGGAYPSLILRNTVEVSITNVTDVMQEAEITASSDELQPHFEQAYLEYQPKAELKGFRKGKVPLAMIKKLYGEAIEYNVLDTVANELYRKAMVDRDIRPIGTPSMVDMDFRRGQSFRFKVKYEVKPAIELKRYKGIAVEKPLHTVTDAEMEAEIHQLRRTNSTTTEVRHVTDTEHIVTADVQELDESGSPLIGKKTPNARFYLADQTLVNEVRDALKNAEVGGAYQATFERQHGDHAHINRIALTVSKIEKVNLPDFDDTFVRKITNDRVASVDEFRANLKNDLVSYWNRQSEKHVADVLANEIVRLHDFPVPESLVKSFLDAFVDDVRDRSKERKLPKGFDEKKFREENRAHAVWQSKWLLLKEKIAEAEGIGVSEDELTKLAEAEADQIGIDRARLVEYYKNSGAVGERLLSEKVMTFLKQHAKVTERVLDEEARA
jgi:trigger factor